MHALSVSNFVQNRWRRLRPIMLRVGNDGVLAFLLSGTALVCYVSTLAPGVLGGDAGELQWANFILLRSLALLPGQHEVVFVFRPASVRWGAIVSIVTVVLAVTCLVLGRRRMVGYE